MKLNRLLEYPQLKGTHKQLLAPHTLGTPKTQTQCMRTSSKSFWNCSNLGL